MAISFILILLAIVIKSICQYYLGAQETSLYKILLGLDLPFYEGWFLGGVFFFLFKIIEIICEIICIKLLL
jgi:hypothetical protein